ncbi:helix-turn-helix domain-containing protein [Flavobacterium sp. RSB2_4_14]|uniref:helix-turn-helix domain-containing protein n=1 Tax=Flavobacterium sp. RSB2_4_14 TaxID=3447665 RepID=UPI003F40B4C5
MKNSEEISIPSVRSIQLLLEPIYSRLETIENCIKQFYQKSNQPSGKYYRNNDLKSRYGLSPNTIIKYRETGILPYTRLGDIYLYEVSSIEKILNQNKVEI